MLRGGALDVRLSEGGDDPAIKRLHRVQGNLENPDTAKTVSTESPDHSALLAVFERLEVRSEKRYMPGLAGSSTAP